MNNWEEQHGTEYRANHKREHYDALTVQFRKDAEDGLTRSRVQAAAAARGLSAGAYIKALLKADIFGA